MAENYDPTDPSQPDPTAGAGTAGSGQHPTPVTDKAKSPREPGRVARNDDNFLDLPVTRLKLGLQNTTFSDVTRYRVWVPTNTGGDLTVTHLDGGTVDIRRPLGKVVGARAKSVNYEVKAGEFGEFFVIAKGKAVKEGVLCTFFQTSFSREGAGDSDQPLIPWTFWYWPTAKGNPHWEKALDIMSRFGKAFGKDPANCRSAEETDHVTAELPSKKWDWQGHCHLAAPSSILFEEPPPQPTSINGQSFSQDEMKFLALEYFGNFGHLLLPVAWELKRGAKVKVNKNLERCLTHYFKPGAGKTRDAFVDGLKSEPNFKKPEEKWDDPTLNQELGKLADIYIENNGGVGGFEAQIDKWQGGEAAEFYQALIDYMRVKKHPLVANMRAYYPDRGPRDVWNHALFWYEAFYLERIPDTKAGELEDENDLIISCVLRVNLDDDLKRGLPAKILDNKSIPLDDTSHGYTNLWRIHFDGSGKIAMDHDRNEWIYIRNAASQELYTPTKLQAVAAPSKTRATDPNLGPLDLGNKFVGTELVDKGLLKIRKRYRSSE